MTINALTELPPVWQELINHAKEICTPENHLRRITCDEGRIESYSLNRCGMFYDFSRQRVTGRTMELLFELARQREIQKTFLAMTNGKKVNTTENRAALHTAARDFSRQTLMVDDVDVMPEFKRVLSEIEEFTRAIHDGAITGTTGKSFRHVVVIGIGGSYLGTEFVARALGAYADKDIILHFLSNVDIHNFGEIAGRIDLETTLWIVVSKSFTTAETMANANQAREFMEARHLKAADHFVAVTSKGSPGDVPPDQAAFPVRRSFHMFDFIGGRYSVSSAVGGLPLSLYIGFDRFKAFLEGAHEMDVYTQNAAPEENIPMIAALISIWNNNFLGYRAQAIIPYAAPLAELAPHIQQLYMESNGKSVTADGRPVPINTGVIIFGEPGTNAQHSFFQLAHQGSQGSPFPIDFIGMINPQYPDYTCKSKGVTNHQELWANLISQPKALAEGREGDSLHRSFSGNRPSSTIILNSLFPKSIGRLLAFYEARTVYEAFVWGINPFDQFGVELGKKLAGDIRAQMAAANENPDHTFDDTDPISKFYLEMLMQ
ncbi:MAG: glucose-6-phosphate isomerase [Thermodesulfobacteriota bacterium]|nr:glucose-6-phosphate isomerase [Thermodesulfobacteriota bacterium]